MLCVVFSAAGLLLLFIGAALVAKDNAAIARHATKALEDRLRDRPK